MIRTCNHILMNIYFSFKPLSVCDFLSYKTCTCLGVFFFIFAHQVKKTRNQRFGEVENTLFKHVQQKPTEAIIASRDDLDPFMDSMDEMHLVVWRAV